MHNMNCFDYWGGAVNDTIFVDTVVEVQKFPSSLFSSLQKNRHPASVRLAFDRRFLIKTYACAVEYRLHH